jgi:hypothetical protein
MNLKERCHTVHQFLYPTIPEFWGKIYTIQTVSRKIKFHV